ncbi:filamentous hemagglutinin N-terminal domain-containing protein [Nostoc sp. UCD121]|uniref:two-partner secretion domain-containing protein n=1 Tax=unclassified Nostoc TaxID=2593658 RepID=UPI00162A8495|nr:MULTISPECIES: filamentous hemagglutinin N-terminal domain-containing protein [unclassified Nostoc]MBC1223874.1 filamentous hemagglutinin N-terminal domain-containing protein [Nostoc sp. UCD120]MBC1275062.1 filamentous hemagglutinin N-terminal domain-containing protein [Nostoc sp. UCD121]MBC1293760.1 filamentous hemagglutinin N-terminal domain-containing protein [Nostoc sp. UCD122]
MSTFWGWFQSLGVAIGGVIVFSVNSAIAQITQDGTLPTIVKTEGSTITIEGGTQVQSNLFHSFNEFSVLNGSTAEFKNADSVQNIISRVTGKSVSNIQGILKANGTANLFLINPNGIIFGPNASLQIGGSFVASTATSLNFADGTKFSTSPQTTPLLTVSVPVGLQFEATAAPIHNQSQASSLVNDTKNILDQNVGLQVRPDKTLALVGGDIVLEGGNLTAPSGRIELGSVASNSLVSLNPTNQGWALGYEGVQDFKNIQLIPRIIDGFEFPSTVDTSGDGVSNIQVHGRHVLLTGGSGIWAITLGSPSGGNLMVTGAESVELIDPNTTLRTGTFGSGNAGELIINTRRLIVQKGSQVGTSTGSIGEGGNLTVNASETVDIIGGSDAFLTALFSITGGAGLAGDVTINTKKLSVQNGAGVSTESTTLLDNFEVTPATGKGGNLTVNASKSVELIGTSPAGNPSGLFASALRYGNTGTINVTTGQLIVRDGAAIAVDVKIPQNAIPSENTNITETPGALNVTARSIMLDEGKLTSNSESGKGGNISLEVQDLLLMRRNSEISTNAGANGDGGKITIYAPKGFLVATPFGNNDITANANFGSGGKITITTKKIFGFVRRTGADVERLDPTGERNPNNLLTSDITAFSQQDPTLNGTVQINSPDTDPSKGLVELPVNLVDASQQIAAGCNSGAKIGSSSFIATGRGGLVADPTQPLIADDAVLADWITLEPESKNSAAGIQKRAVLQAQRNTEEKSQKVNSVNEPTQIVEAQGWVMDADGNVVLVAQVPTASPHNSSLTATSCAAR